MLRRIQTAHFFGLHGNAITIDIGLIILRVCVGLAFMTIFEKVLPREGIWGPQQWFIEDVAKMGFPAPVVFAWMAVLIEFVGGFLLIIGLGSRFAALSNAGVTFVAAFIYHHGDVGQSGLAATVFFMMCAVLTITGPGRFSIDGFLAKKFLAGPEASQQKV
ncbi:MAG: DoxX family protein [Candidatus Hydrogenedentes bacterium]|nr:DoxX family protein [Candidatus Hydrogenedentota bacterium]